MVGSVMVRRGKVSSAWRFRIGSARIGLVRHGAFRRLRSGGRGVARHVRVRCGWRGLAGCGMAVAVRSGLERYGEAGRGGQGWFRYGSFWLGKAVMEGYGRVRLGWVRRSWFG